MPPPTNPPAADLTARVGSDRGQHDGNHAHRQSNLEHALGRVLTARRPGSSLSRCESRRWASIFSNQRVVISERDRRNQPSRDGADHQTLGVQ